ncbi:MAG TPA: carboxylate--amine ligase, partial [Acidimicrobiales bacterium]|nr:carboxylate--amine ligase [Acidimicrobiales bacterium]
IPTMREVASLAAMAQSLVEWMDTRLDAGEKLRVPREWVVKQNKWKASRHGLDADNIVDDRGTRVPLRDAICELVADLSPTAARLGCLDELTANLDVLDHGASYRRQRAIVAGGGSLEDVVDSLVAELEVGRPRPV